MSTDRIDAELVLLREGGVDVEYFPSVNVVLYRDVPTRGADFNLPTSTDVVVPVPSGYPASAIDLGGLPVGSPLLGRVKGNPNGPVLKVDEKDYKLVSFHPHGNEGDAWDPARHGFHTYYTWILSWLSVIT